MYYIPNFITPEEGGVFWDHVSKLNKAANHSAHCTSVLWYATPQYLNHVYLLLKYNSLVAPAPSHGK